MRTRILTASGTVVLAALLAIPAIAASQKSASEPAKSANSAASAGPAETINGTVWTVNVAKHLLTIKDATGVPFDIVVAPSTRIKSGQQELKMSDLFSANKVSVEIVPESRGDVAESIVVKSSS